jgi:hypothetical protein
LANDLVAVVAAGSLKARELWRLNGEGSLARPAIWPSSLASLFWPCLLGLVLVLALVVGLGSRLPGRPAGPNSLPTPDSVEVDQARPSSFQAEGKDDADGNAGLGGLGPQNLVPDGAAAEGSAPRDASIPDPAPEAPEAPATPTPNSTSNSTTISATTTSATGPEVAVPDVAVAEIPPLVLSDLVGPEPPLWMLELQDRPAEGLLRLRLAGGYGELPLAERRSLAEQWLERSRELGYERFELVDRQGRLLARPARVGSGMILLDALSSPP